MDAEKMTTTLGPLLDGVSGMLAAFLWWFDAPIPDRAGVAVLLAFWTGAGAALAVVVFSAVGLIRGRR